MWQWGARPNVRLRRHECTAIIRRGLRKSPLLGSLEASAPQRFKCIMGNSNRGSATVRSRGGVLSRDGPFSEVPLYIHMSIIPLNGKVWKSDLPIVRRFSGVLKMLNCKV